MNKSAKNIIILCGAVVVLGGGLIALKMTEPKDNPTEESPVSETSKDSEAEGSGITVVADEKADEHGGVISEVSVKNADGILHVVVDKEATEDSAQTYTLADYKDIPLNTALVGTLANNAVNMVSESVVEENGENLAKFGLDNPQAEVEIKFKSGTTKKLIIGDKAPANSETYVMIDDEKTVYTVSTSYVANYSKALNDFIETTILEKPDDDNMPIVESVKIEREDIDYDIVLEYDKKSDDGKYSGGTSAKHVMTEPTEAYLTVERSEPVTNGMFGLIADSIYSVKCSASDIAQAGLKEPFCKVTMKCDDGKSYTLLMSEPFTDENNKKCCYAMFEDGKVIYTVNTENAKWAIVMPIDITSRIMIGSYVWNITDLSVKCSDGTEENFTIKLKDEKMDLSDAKTADFEVRRNGGIFDSERYRQFYGFLISSSAEEFALGEKVPTGKPTVTITYSDSYTKTTTTIDFYDYSNLTSLIVINGESKYFCSKSYVDTLIDNIGRIETGEEYVTTWK
ncbi:MAG: DUF4340 domain-containing protein [Ruminococcus sp.]|nr:DUF4340 domain-containing protein [Ruminococcus sp.]